jgi:MFS family permease
MRTFYALIIAQVVSLIGSRISGLAMSIWVYQQTGDATPLALVQFFGFLPSVLAAGAAGVLADRYDRRYMMALADAGQALGTVFLLISFTSGAFQLWHLYTVTLIHAIFGMFQTPAFLASVTMLVPDEHRDRANAIQQLSGPFTGIVAPAIAGVIYSLVQVTGAIVLDLVTFFVAVAIVLSIRIPHPAQTAEGRAARGSVWREVWGGVRYLWARRPLFALILHMSLLNLLISAVSVLLTPYILARTGSEMTLGAILAVMNGGAVAGSLVMGARGKKPRSRVRVSLLGIMVMGLFFAGVGISQVAMFVGLTLFGVMFCLPFISASFRSMLQLKVAPDIQGRVFAVTTQLATLLMPLAFLLVGPLADHVFEPAVGQAGWQAVAPLVGSSAGSGMGLMMVIGGLMAVLLTLVVYTVPAIRNLETTLPDYQPVAVPAREAVAAEG